METNRREDGGHGMLDCTLEVEVWTFIWYRIIALVNVNDDNKSNDNYDDDGGRWEVTWKPRLYFLLIASASKKSRNGYSMKIWDLRPKTVRNVFHLESSSDNVLTMNSWFQPNISPNKQMSFWYDHFFFLPLQANSTCNAAVPWYRLNGSWLQLNALHPICYQMKPLIRLSK